MNIRNMSLISLQILILFCFIVLMPVYGTAEITVHLKSGRTIADVDKIERLDGKVILTKNGLNIKIPEKDILKIEGLEEESSVEDFSLVEDPQDSINKQIEHLGELSKAGKTEEFIQYIKKHDLINKADKDGDTPLITSVLGHEKAIEYLIRNGSRVNHQNIQGLTALSVAIAANNVKAVQVLLKNKADVKLVTTDGESPLLMAVILAGIKKPAIEGLPFSYEKLITIINILIDHGAEINRVTKKNETALSYAVFFKDTKLVRILMKNGANPNIKLAENVSILDIAIENAHNEIINILRDNGAKTAKELN